MLKIEEAGFCLVYIIFGQSSDAAEERISDGTKEELRTLINSLLQTKKHTISNEY